MATLRQVDAAREHLLASGVIPEHLAKSVRPQVLQSWKRSLLSGAGVANPSLEFRGEHHARAALRLAANPVLSRLAEELSGLDAGVLLSDHEAVVVERWVSDAGILSQMDRINSDAGFCVSEEVIGTNGVGTVIEVDRAIQITGPEHLADTLRPFTCVGVPVHHPITRRLEGVITMNCRATSHNPLLTPLMTSTAQEVESRLLAQASTDERLLLDAYLVAIGARRAPIAAIGQDIFMAGPRVTDLLEGVDRAVLWEYVRGVALGSRGRAEELGLATDRFRITRCTPVERDGTVIGALVEFDLYRTVPDDFTAAATPRRPVTLPGKSPALMQATAHATRLASKGVPILIEGEAGVGKFALARAVLESAQVPADKVAVVDAAAGSAEGAGRFLTELRREIDGRPEALVVRHVETLPSEAAAATASLLEELDEQPAPPRIIATLTPTDATTPGLRRLVDTVGVGRVTLRPLRDRSEDIAPTALALLEKHRGPRQLHFSSAALRYLMRAPWPGNLRQLDATIRGLISTCPGPEIRPEHLPLDLQGSSRKRNLSAIEELELSAILGALKQHNGNKVAAAQAIGISRSTLYRKLQAYRLDPDKQYF
ncbi:sigma-54-dependent Fis family transcriptional regulator [Blastococcus sp. PRF04-17]|uniref:sigma-54-dependent Fis family transcriptional regulator n=1 Tax=Blastococcus sp. PRF04-17 TaxID=2933797 RepID=UPI001FF577D0|nr:helix-turn-helix domain-containing protein [Blastococcus sp. PRF04-17]UOY02608.1 sigma 54-interacting transcriptional regulator [Blastococcus sp. PRF04-17]